MRQRPMMTTVRSQSSRPVKSGIRRKALIAAVVTLIPVSSHSQAISCTLPATVRVSWRGAYTGCGPANDYRPCAATEPITFTVTGIEKAIPICAAYLWDFGDKTPQSPSASPTHIYAKPGTSNFFVRVRGTSQESGDGAAFLILPATVL